MGRAISFWVLGIVAVGVCLSVASLSVIRGLDARLWAAADAFAQAQATGAAERIGVYLGDASAVARVMAASVGQIRGNRPLAKKILIGLMRARRNPSILAMGFYFPPGVFDASGKEFAPYSELDTHGRPFLLGDDNSGPREAWIRLAQASPNRVVLFGPDAPLHKRGTSAFLAVYEGKRFVGLASVDTWPRMLTDVIGRGLAPGTVAYMTDANGRRMLATGPIPSGDGYRELDRTLRSSRARLYVVSDIRGTRTASRRLDLAGAAGILGIWIALALAVIALTRTERNQEKTLELELEQRRLQDEIATRIEVEKRLREAAYVDTLTALPNRSFLIEDISLVLSVPGTVHEYGVLHVDLDRFNLVNDTHGHPMGDELLRRVGMRLLDALPEEAVVARLGGDEFAVLVHGGSRAVLHYAASVVELLRLPILLRERDIYLTASVGVVLLDGTYREPQDVLRDAEIAMYEAKGRGRNAFATFDTFMRRRVERELELGHDLRRAIDQNAFVAHYQSIVDLNSGSIASFEALARWDRDGEIVGAAAFIPHAERQGLVGEIDEQIFDCVCAEIGSTFPHDAPIAINLSAAHLTEPRLVPRVRAALERYRIAPNRIKLEVTETAIMTNATRSLRSLQELRDLGIEIVVDDFGTGHSSLAYLQRLPIAGVKIDRSFISTIERDEQAREIVRSIVALAGAIRLYTVAEGIENDAQLQILRNLGVKYGQGFFFSRPVPAEQLGQSTPEANESAS